MSNRWKCRLAAPRAAERARRDRDLSGALVPLGGAAVMFSSPENVLQLFGYAGVQ